MNIVILAAGQGKRMRSALPKVLQPLAGRPLLAHVIDSARATARRCQTAARIVVVVGHGGQAVRSAFSEQPDLHFVEQTPQLGTGHAVLQAVPWLREDVATLVLYGDVPLVRSQTLVALVETAAGHLGMLTVRLANPSGYGR
ncbi:MAG TPA: NTP transferase domain-containing protein, partial [Burkholderiaceae bacterium]|nr:NTP transferase domain-containing protein [Burkholderiaceae bacterium]